MTKRSTRQLINEIVAQPKYYSVDAVKYVIRDAGENVPPLTINQYLYDLRRKGEIHNAGRGWYSSIAEERPLAAPSVSKLVAVVERNYPLLSFSAWSMEQLQPFAHHVMTKFTQFLYVETEAQESVVALLRDEGYTAYPNPTNAEIARYFTPSSQAVIVRTAITREPVEGHLATAEKILVDLYVEKGRLALMDDAEYRRVFLNLATSRRLNLGRLLGYAGRRKISSSILHEVILPAQDIFLVPRERRK